MTWVLGISRGWKWDRQTELESHHLMCRPGVSPKGEKERRTEKTRARHSRTMEAEGFWGRRKEWKERKEEKKWRGGPCVNFKKPLTAAAAAAATSPDHSTDAFVPCTVLNPPLPLLIFSSLFAWCLWWSIVRGAGAIKATTVCYRLQNPGPPSIRQPQSSYLRGPSGKPHTLEEKYLICPLCKDQQSHKRQERSGIARGGGGGGWREEEEVGGRRGQGKWGRVS